MRGKRQVTRLVTFAAAAMLALLAGAGPSAARPVSARSDAALQVLNSPAGRFLTPAVRTALQEVAGVKSASATRSIAGPGAALAPASSRLAVVSDPGLVNWRVNDPGQDAELVDQTTQKAPAIAVSGSHVVVGFYDSQAIFGNTFTAGTNTSGVAYSADGGQTFTDAGVVPMAPGYFGYVGNPSVASDAAGNFYYSNDLFKTRNFNFVPGVARSLDGGKTWSTPIDVAADVEANKFGYSTEFPALTSGTGGLYEAWDAIDNNTSSSFLELARSTDGGRTWKASHISRIPLFTPTCDFAAGCLVQFYQGAHPLVAADGTAYVAAEIRGNYIVNYHGTEQDSEVIFSSTDGGTTWSQGATIAISSSTQGLGAFDLGPGRLQPNSEFPTIGVANGSLLMAWNDGGDGSGHSHIRLARSRDAGRTWTMSWVTSGGKDEIQPAISTDTAGAHVLYYQLTGSQATCLYNCVGTGSANGQVDVLVSNSTDASTWSTRRVSNQTSPGIFTAPPFDPFTPYFGEYVANVSDGTHQYFAWGDNRDIVTNYLWPQGRHDVDVYFARQ